MKHAYLVACAVGSSLLAAQALAADPAKLPGNKRLMDYSNKLLISEDEAKKTMDENIPEKVWKITKGSQYVWVSQVEGGMNGSTCVVSARVMVLPLTTVVNAPLFRPRQTATAFDAAVNSSTDACKTLAKSKLKEATLAVVSSIVKS
jgi:hypothetical protein